MSRARFESLQARVLLHAMGDIKKEEDGGNAAEFSDLLALAQNYGSVTPTWTADDFDQSGAVGFTDLLALAQNYSGSFSQAISANFSADWQLTHSLMETATAEGSEDLSKYSTAAVNSKGKLQVFSSGTDVLVEQRDNVTSVTFATGQNVSPTQSGRTLTFRKVRSIEINGTSADDTITLGPGLRATTIHAGKGNDLIICSDETAFVHAGEGDDTIFAGAGNDEIYGDAGDDSLNGGTGDDLLDGGAGKDRLNGHKGKNRLIGGSGTDYLKVYKGKDKPDRDAKDKLTELE